MPNGVETPTTGLIADNVIGFARALRVAGLPIGPGLVIDALNAMQLIDIGNRADLFTTLESIFVKRHEHALIFAQAFDLFFRRAEGTNNMLDSVPLPPEAQKPPPPASRRVQEAFAQSKNVEIPRDRRKERSTLGIGSRGSAIKRFRADERRGDRRGHAGDRADEAAAGRIANAPLCAGCRGERLDLRRTLRGSLRTGGEIVKFQRLGRIDKPAPIVALLDISGSMTEYTRLFLQFLHAITDARKRVSVFLFGTRLTNVTRALRARDPDEAPGGLFVLRGGLGGGTRIATSLHNFNNLWGRRVLGQGAIVLLISDGLEREVDSRLEFEMDRLHRSCRRLIWLNPLLRFDGFEAKAQGIKMMLPHVDEFRPVHNLNSMESLIAALSSPLATRRLDSRSAA